jgi:site-specific DNA-methyltransferase (adenine-specific)
MERLYFGDNLDVLCEYVSDESIDLIYLDPPFNSKRNYNLLFKSPRGHRTDAQINRTVSGGVSESLQLGLITAK